MKKLLSVLLAVLMLVTITACGKDDGSLESYLENNNLYEGIEDYPTAGGENVPGDLPATDDVVDGSTANNENLTLEDYIPEGGDAIPESLVGSWSYVEIYQWALASDITVDEAINREKAVGIHFSYITFTRYSETVENPVYSTNTSATYNDMTAFGIDPSGLMELYGENASITSVAVATPDGATCTTVFLINDSVLIAFGEGMNVFMYEAVEAVG